MKKIKIDAFKKWDKDKEYCIGTENNLTDDNICRFEDCFYRTVIDKNKNTHPSDNKYSWIKYFPLHIPKHKEYSIELDKIVFTRDYKIGKAFIKSLKKELKRDSLVFDSIEYNSNYDYSNDYINSDFNNITEKKLISKNYFIKYTVDYEKNQKDN